MKLEERLGQLEEEISIANKQISELLKWKANCNVLMAWWGGVMMAALTAGSAIVEYYHEIKAYLMALWKV